METNEILREQIFEIIKNQMKNNEPPETNKTFNPVYAIEILLRL